MARTVNLDELSDAQRQVYDSLAQGRTPEQAATALGTTLGVVNAQMTRIRNKGIPLPGDEGYPVEGAARVPENPALINPAAALAARVGGSTARDIHTMILLGCAIQFVKLCGGRIIAHQVIEDVYSALRAFAADSGKPVPGEDGGTQPPPQTDKERLTFLEEQNRLLQDRVRELEGRLRSQNPAQSMS